MDVCLYAVVVVVAIVVINCGLDFCVFERMGFCEVEVVLNWSEG